MADPAYSSGDLQYTCADSERHPPLPLLRPRCAAHHAGRGLPALLPVRAVRPLDATQAGGLLCVLQLRGRALPAQAEGGPFTLKR